MNIFKRLITDLDFCTFAFIGGSSVRCVTSQSVTLNIELLSIKNPIFQCHHGLIPNSRLRDNRVILWLPVTQILLWQHQVVTRFFNNKREAFNNV